MLDWKKLLSSERLKTGIDLAAGGAAVAEARPSAAASARTPFEADYGRVIFSAATRRLAGKTQVHPFSSVDYVHNRLTHSLEVSTVAYSLVRELDRFFVSEVGLDAGQTEAVAWIVRTAALAHDLGNPPYGHAGEFAIRQWAGGEGAASILPPDAAADFRLYDGNAQTFRLLSRSDLRDSSYFRLTLAALGAGVKYPFRIGSPEAEGAGKCAAFSSEAVAFDCAMSALGLKRGGGYVRHPLSYLVEAADDICYLLADMEDAIALHVLREGDVKRLVLRLRHPISSSADTVHFVRSCGNAVIDNLTVRLEQDDALNAHDRFTVARPVAPRKLEVVLERGARYFRPGVGNAVELRDPGYNATGWTGVCTAAEGETVEVDRDLPDATPREGYFLLLDRTASSDGLIVRNCTFEDMEMRVLVNVSNATIENCVFRRTNGDALRCIADYTLGQWAEGMGARNIVVRNCRFEGNCVRELVGEYWSLGADFATWLGHPDAVAPERLDRDYVSDILVEGCTFVDSLGYFADLRTGTDITFRNNRIERTGRRAECRETSGSARVEGACGVRFENNEFHIPAGTPAPRVDVLRRAGNGTVSLKDNRIFRRAGWPGDTPTPTTSGESRERQQQ